MDELEVTIGRLRLALQHRDRARAIRILDDLFGRTADDPRLLPYHQRLALPLARMFPDDEHELIRSHLREIGCETVGDLTRLTVLEVSAVPNFGSGRVKTIQKALKSWGLSLRSWRGKGRLLSQTAAGTR